VQKTLEFPAVLRLIDERSAAFRAAAKSAADLGGKVPTCPEWTLLDLVHHLGKVQRRWAAIVTAGPTDADPPALEGGEAPPREREALLAWSAEGTRQLLEALSEAGPDRRCWTWWGEESDSPETSGAIGRHQVQEVTVHAYDAQITAGAPQPLPDEAALDGVEEFLSTCVSTESPWPHEAAVIDFHAAEGGSWRLLLSADGARSSRLAEPGTAPDASARATASEHVLVFYDRLPLDTLQMDGNRLLLEQLRDWDPDA